MNQAARRKRAEEYIELSGLTDEQRAVCDRFLETDDSFVVRACPGSGKTRTAGALFACAMVLHERRHSGVATVSYSNVAWREVSAQLGRLARPTVPAWPHFLGTIHRFVNRHLALPFGHIPMGIGAKRLEIMGPSSEAWVKTALHVNAVAAYSPLAGCYRKGCNASNLTYDRHGNPRRTIPRKQPRCDQEHCLSVKKRMVESGYANDDDSMYWGMRSLELQGIAAAVATRFPVIIVDEAQDTSDVQMAIIEQLADAGARLIVIGDPDQAIYEFNGARPELFVALAEKWPRLGFAGTFRCSQLISKATQRFSSMETPMSAVGDAADCGTRPTVVRYRREQAADLPGAFVERAKSAGIAEDSCVLLARGTGLVGEMQGGGAWPKGPGSETRRLARAAILCDLGEFGDAHQEVMRSVLRMGYDTEAMGANYETVKKVGIRRFRRETWALLRNLPSTDLTLHDWAQQLRPPVAACLDRLGIVPPVNLRQSFLKGSKCQDALATVVELRGHTRGVLCKTVHQAKGETFDAVMVACRKQDIGRWLKPTKAGAEDQRIGYVAMTRARRMLVLAVPEDTAQKHLDEFAEHFDIEEGVLPE